MGSPSCTGLDVPGRIRGIDNVWEQEYFTPPQERVPVSWSYHPQPQTLNWHGMSMLPTYQESQDYRTVETGGTRWESRLPYQQPSHPEFDQESYEDGLHTDAQFGLNYQTQSLHTNREAPMMPNLYDGDGQDPNVFAHSITLYHTDIPHLTQYDPPRSTLCRDSASFFLTGAPQVNEASDEASYRSPIDYTNEAHPLESFDSVDTSTTRESADPTRMTAHPALRTVKTPETTGNEEGEGEMAALCYGGGGSWKCTICSKSFRRRRRAVLHVLNMHNYMRIPCDGLCGSVGCDKSFATQEGLDVHARPVTVECTSCGKSMLKRNLHRHSKLYCPQSSEWMPGETLPTQNTDEIIGYEEATDFSRQYAY